MRDVNRRPVAPGRPVRAVADASRLGHFTSWHVRGIYRISGLITGSRAEPRWRAALDKAWVPVLAAGVKEQQTVR